jgi:hypothetical protein
VSFFANSFVPCVVSTIFITKRFVSPSKIVESVFFLRGKRTVFLLTKILNLGYRILGF